MVGRGGAPDRHGLRRARARRRRAARARRRRARPPARARRPLRRRRDRARADRRRARRGRPRRHRRRSSRPARSASAASRRSRCSREAYGQVREAGWRLVNADCVLVGEEPRIAAHREEMRRRLAEAIGEGEVNVRATTTDRLGFPGPRRGARRAGGRAARAPVNLVRYADRPELVERRSPRVAGVPEFMTTTRWAAVLDAALLRLPGVPAGAPRRRRDRRRGPRPADPVGRHG